MKLKKVAAALAAAAALAHMVWVVPALAHRVNLFAWVEGDTVFVECKYPDGKRVKEGLIRVLDKAGAEVLSGRTDAQGKFSFKVLEAADLTLVLEAGMGHRAEWPLAKEEFSPGAQASGTSGHSVSGPPEKAPGPAPQAAPSAPPEARPPGASAEDIERAVEKALDRKLAPVLKMIAETRDPGPRLADVLGGLGYIMGLVGIAAYFKSRKPCKADA